MFPKASSPWRVLGEMAIPTHRLGWDALSIHSRLRINSRGGLQPKRVGWLLKDANVMRVSQTGDLHGEVRRVGLMKMSISAKQNGPVTEGEVNSRLLQEETVLIVGAGIAGLSTAVALHRVGLKAVVLEQADSLRTTGTAVSLWTNAWRVLDVLGVGPRLRSQYTGLLRWQIFNEHGEQLGGLNLPDCAGGPHELRPVERKVLLETLAEQLPPGTIRFNSRVKSIQRAAKSNCLNHVELQDGSIYSAKILVGCDGANSVVAAWMGLPKTHEVGQCAIRGMAVFPEGHKFKDEIHYYVGQGVRTAVVPSTSTKVYWFVLWNENSKGSKVTDPKLLKEEASRHIEGWSCDTKECIDNTPPENFIRNSIRHRWNFPLISRTPVIDGVTLAGDALHPMTPNLGQGGCTALEDSVILAQKLFQALSGSKKGMSLGDATEGERGSEVDSLTEMQRITSALLEFQAERRARTFPLTLQSYIAGVIMQSELTPVCYLRDKYIIPKSLNPQKILNHTLFDVGTLPVVSTKETLSS